MIELTHGNLLDAEADALVNTVNCVGVMGKGLALQFKQAFPENFRAYERACRAGEVKPGHMLTRPTGKLTGPKYIVNFPTKRHWKGNSRIEDIDAGLEALVEEIQRLEIKSIAVPPLGCGNGGLRWEDVRPRIEAALGQLPGVRVLLSRRRQRSGRTSVGQAVPGTGTASSFSGASARSLAPAHGGDDFAGENRGEERFRVAGVGIPGHASRDQLTHPLVATKPSSIAAVASSQSPARFRLGSLLTTRTRQRRRSSISLAPSPELF